MGLVKKQLSAKGKLMEDNESAQEIKIKCTDLNYLNRRTKSDPALMMEMISLYLEQTPPLVAAMKKSLREKDWKLLQAAVHKMIPSFSIMGMSPDYESIAIQVKEYAASQQQTDGIDLLVSRLEKICEQACLELEEDFISIKNFGNADGKQG